MCKLSLWRGPKIKGYLGVNTVFGEDPFVFQITSFSNAVKFNKGHGLGYCLDHDGIYVYVTDITGMGISKEKKAILTVS